MPLRNLEGILAGLLLAAAVFLVVLEILLRTLFSYSLMGVSVIASFLIIWSTLLGASYAIAENMHVRVDLLAHMVPVPVAKTMEVVVTLVCLGFSVAVGLSGIALVRESHMLGDTTVGFWEIPMWIPQLAMPVAGCLFSARFLERLYTLFRSPLKDRAQVEQRGSNVGST